MSLAANHKPAAAAAISLNDTAAAVNHARGRKIRPGNQTNEFVQSKLRLLNQGDAGVDHFRDIMRWDIGRHAYGDAGGAIHE